MKAGPRKDEPQTQGTFQQFLNWLDEGVDSEGGKYLEMRRRLVTYFDRKSCLSPDELADETLARVARRLAEEGAIKGTTPAHYCYIVAKFVFLEYTRRGDRRQVRLDELPDSGPAAAPLTAPALHDEERESREHLLACLDRCSRNLDPDHRELILEYYHGDGHEKIERRRLLAQRLGLSSNALSIRACRIRDKLESCVRRCSGES